jgi:U3 small nucleolar RNA-associated protein 7
VPGVLTFQDTSTGDLVASHRTKLGRCEVLRHNPWNAVTCLGHTNGTVSMWVPSQATPVVRMLAHRGAVTALAVDRTGNRLLTAGADCKVCVWDLRTYKKLHAYSSPRPAAAVDISHRGHAAVAFSSTVQVWDRALDGAAKADAPLLVHRTGGARVAAARFCPHEDILGLGTGAGMESVLAPGSGDPVFDAFEANPYQTLRQRREGEVRSLLEKLPAASICVDPERLATVAAPDAELRLGPAEAEPAAPGDAEVRNRARGRQRAGHQQRRSTMKAGDKKRARIEAVREEQDAKVEEARVRRIERAKEKHGVLARFAIGDG